MEDIEILIGSFSLIFCIISTVIGLIVASKYRKYKQNTLLYVGLSLPGLAFPWYPSAISFLVALVNGVGLPPQVYFLIGNAFVPISLFLWMLALTELIFKKHQKEILIIYIIIGIIFEIYFLYTLFTDYNAIGELKGAVDVEYFGITRIYLIFTLLSIFISSVLFNIQCFKSDSAEVRLKGIFLMIGLILYTIGAIADGFIPLDFVTLPIIRILLIISMIMYYHAWILPTYMKKLLLKEQ
ncbi:MAG: hypothetical protein EU540_08285 [Promethearchaeota archaeon]|nr:MAG: hypothetical protein EU540_08285 [Candidatus Lokiarchaeota archaeon]